MRVLELSTRLASFNRKDGESATAKAAYRAGEDIYCEREGKEHAYARRKGVELAEIVLPATAPAWAKDRARLWNEAELIEKNGKRGPRGGQWKENVVTAREWLFALPHELSAEGRKAVARAVAEYLTTQHGLAVDFSIHTPGAEGDIRNFHIHMMMTSRRMSATGLGKKATEFSNSLEEGSKLTLALRALTAKTINARLAAEGKAHLVKVEHKSFKDRGVQRQPTKHQGVAKTNTKRKKLRNDRQAWAAAHRNEQKTTQG